MAVRIAPRTFQIRSCPGLVFNIHTRTYSNVQGQAPLVGSQNYAFTIDVRIGLLFAQSKKFGLLSLLKGIQHWLADLFMWSTIATMAASSRARAWISHIVSMLISCLCLLLPIMAALCVVLYGYTHTHTPVHTLSMASIPAFTIERKFSLLVLWCKCEQIVDGCNDERRNWFKYIYMFAKYFGVWFIEYRYII